MSNNTLLIVRQLKKCQWLITYNAMHQFIRQRNNNTYDELWLVEHDPIFTQGYAGKAEHILMSGDIPVLQSDRGGQITYHGPGQQILYVMIDIKRHNINVRQLITILEKTVILTLQEYNILAYSNVRAPGVYVKEYKICSLGLRIQKGCSFHGLALNVTTELSPFLRINPCGYSGLRMGKLSQFIPGITVDDIQPKLVKYFAELLGFAKIQWYL